MSQISFCTPSFFFNVSQRFGFIVYDLRQEPLNELKNTLHLQNFEEIQNSTQIEKFINSPIQSKQKMLNHFQLRKRLYNFIFPFTQVDMFSIQLTEQVQMRMKNSDHCTFELDQVQQWCQYHQQENHKKRTTVHRAQTVKVEESFIQVETPTLMSSRKMIELDDSRQADNNIILIQRSESSPQLDDKAIKCHNFIDFQLGLSLLLVKIKLDRFISFMSLHKFYFLSIHFLIMENLKIEVLLLIILAYLDKCFPNEIIQNKLYLGAGEHAKDVIMLEDQLHITHIVNCTIEMKNYSKKIKYFNIKILDEPQMKICKYFEQAYQFIEDAIQNNGKVLVHCAQGKSRSACIVTMYLMKHYKWQFEKAYEYVKNKREIVEINDGFIDQLIKV